MYSSCLREIKLGVYLWWVGDGKIKVVLRNGPLFLLEGGMNIFPRKTFLCRCLSLSVAPSCRQFFHVCKQFIWAFMFL